MMLVRFFLIIGLVNLSCNARVNHILENKTKDTASKNVSKDFFFLKDKKEIYVPISKKKDLSKEVLNQITKEINPQNHLMVPINSEEGRRLSVYLCSLENTTWNINLSFSEHKKKYAKIVQDEILKTIQNDSLINALEIDFIQFPVSFYEKDQLKILDWS